MGSVDVSKEDIDDVKLATDDVQGDKEAEKLEKKNCPAFVGPRGKYCLEWVNEMLWRKKFSAGYFSFFIRIMFWGFFESNAIENNSYMAQKTG